MEAQYNQIKFTDSDIVNLSDWIPAGEYNPHNVRPWLLHDHGFVLCVVFADCCQDAVDEAADHGKLDHFRITEDEHADYDMESQDPKCCFLGNASEPFDIETLGIVELPNPKASWIAQFNATKE